MENKFNLKNSLSFKLFVIGFLIGILMIPTGMIFALVSDRQDRQEDAFREVSEKWGGEQIIAGPVLSVPYKKVSSSFVNGETKVDVIINYAHFLPEKLDIDGQITPEIRRRGIYEVALYQTNLNFSGEFSFPDFSAWDILQENIMYDKAFVSLGIPDLRGVKENIDLEWNDKSLAFEPGIETNEVLASGVSVAVPLDLAERGKKNIFSFALKLNGSRNLLFTPFGKETNVKLHSDWQTPSFQGAFLPNKRELGADGFSAEWKVLELNRNFPQKFLGSLGGQRNKIQPPGFIDQPMTTLSSRDFSGSEFGVELLIPADQYQKTTRVLKYAVMILALTFLVLFFFEAYRKRSVHPLQYILIGLALSLFYVLLLAIAEQLGFDWSYLLSTVATVGIIMFYSKSIFKSWRSAFLEALILVFIYGFIFVILQLEDYSLLVGAIGLFIILAIVMFVSRKIDWYVLNSGNH